MTMALVPFDSVKQIVHLFALPFYDLEEQAILVIKKSSNRINGIVGSRIVQQIEKIPLAEGLRCLAGINKAGLFQRVG